MTAVAYNLEMRHKEMSYIYWLSDQKLGIPVVIKLIQITIKIKFLKKSANFKES